jgi:hypothetical protein
MPEIAKLSTGFGWIKVSYKDNILNSTKYKDKIYEQDILIDINGNAFPRNEDELRRKFGTCHAVSKEEMEFLLKGNPKVIVFGTGQTGMARLSAEAKALLMKAMRTRIIEGTTPAAVKKFDALSEPKTAVFHITC